MSFKNCLKIIHLKDNDETEETFGYCIDSITLAHQIFIVATIRLSKYNKFALHNC